MRALFQKKTDPTLTAFWEQVFENTESARLKAEAGKLAEMKDKNDLTIFAMETAFTGKRGTSPDVNFGGHIIITAQHIVDINKAVKSRAEGLEAELEAQEKELSKGDYKKLAAERREEFAKTVAEEICSSVEEVRSSCCGSRRVFDLRNALREEEVEASNEVVVGKHTAQLAKVSQVAPEPAEMMR